MALGDNEGDQKMDLGVCYFPEHWAAEQIEDDIEQMAAAGLNYVRMGEFAWSRLEPDPHNLTFEWLERAVSLINSYDMQVVLCTPTATPPKWLVDRYPDILQEENDGTVRHYGSRRHYCYNSNIYRQESRRIVKELAQRFADNPGIVGWQTDNEFGCHGTIRCYCDDCANAFREWLRDRYGTIQTLNDAWGTTFWSQYLTSFAQVDPPRHTAAAHHPGRLLDYYRFASDSVVEYNSLQTKILRAANDDWFITHNFMSHFDALDAYELSKDLDFASWDSYPTGHVQVQRENTSKEELRVGDPDQIGLDHDLYRNTTGAAPWVMEQQPGDINWPPYSPQPADGAMRLWAHYAFAHGVDVVSYFRWRRCRMGQEQYHSGLLAQDDSADTGLQDVTEVVEDLAELGDAADNEPSVPGADVAILHSYDNAWALEIERNTPDFDYWQHIETYYRALRERSVTVDIIPPIATLDNYDAIVAPTLYLLDPDLAARLTGYVDNGGELLITMRSGVKDTYNKLHDTRQPGPLRSLIGAEVSQHESIPKALESDVTYYGERFGCGSWNEWLSPVAESTEVIGRYKNERADGKAAIVHNTASEGSVIYIGTWPDASLVTALVGDLLERANIAMSDPLPRQVRFTRRNGLTWIFNFRSESLMVTAPTNATWLLGSAEIDAYDVGVTDAVLSTLSIDES